MLRSTATLAFLTAAASAATFTLRTIPTTADSAVCNDGSPYVYYVSMGTEADKWVAFQEGGSYCWSEASCNERKSKDSNQMTSHGAQATLSLAYGIMSDDPTNNPNYATWNKVLLMYCTSDAFSGTVEKSTWSDSLSFLGSRVVPSVIADLKETYGLVDGSDTVFIYSGASAGAVGMWPNLDRLSTTLLPTSRVVGVIDSGWFLDSTQMAGTPQCSGDDPLLCSVKENLQNGVTAWSPYLNKDCAAAKAANEQWQCLMGHYVEPYISTPIFVMEWQYDLAQLYHDGIENNPTTTTAELNYAQTSRANLTKTFLAAQQHHQFFSPACYQHVLINNLHPNWYEVTANNVTIIDALEGFVSGKGSTTSILMDTCKLPDCNPTCPPPQHIG